MSNEILNSTICAKSGSTMTIRDSIDYIVSIILAGLNPANGCWYKSSEKVEYQLQDATNDKELIDSIMKQFNNHVSALNNSNKDLEKTNHYIAPETNSKIETQYKLDCIKKYDTPNDYSKESITMFVVVSPGGYPSVIREVKYKNGKYQYYRETSAILCIGEERIFTERINVLHLFNNVLPTNWKWVEA